MQEEFDPKAENIAFVMNELARLLYLRGAALVETRAGMVSAASLYQLVVESCNQRIDDAAVDDPKGFGGG